MEATGLNRSMAEAIVNAQGDEPSEDIGTVSEADLNDNLTIAQLEDTRFLTLTYSDEDKRTKAQEVVNNAAEVFAREAPEASGMAAHAAAKVSAYAGVPRSPRGTRPAAQRLRGARHRAHARHRLGLLARRVYLHLRGLHSPEKVEQISGVPTFGTIPDFEASQASKWRRGPAA